MTTSCTLCGKPLLPSHTVADLHVYKLGELDSILLAHVACAKTNDAARGTKLWCYDDRNMFSEHFNAELEADAAGRPYSGIEEHQPGYAEQ